MRNPLIGQDKFVSIQYSFSTNDGALPAFLAQEHSSSFVFGRDRILPVLEEAIAGRTVNEEVSIHIPAREAFGPYDPDLVNEISASRVKNLSSLKEGEVYEERGPDGQPVMFTVRKIGPDSVTMDFNHPAAGKDIILNVKILEVREPSFTELMASMNLFKGGG